MTRLLVLAGCLLSVTVSARGGTEPVWPQFRGPGGGSVSDHPGLPDSWSTTENVAWKAAIPGRGWSSPIVWGNRVFVTTVVNESPEEKPKEGLYFGGERPKPPSTKHEWIVCCLELITGNVLWKKTVHEGIPASGRHLKNSYASETPVTDGQFVYAYFGNLGIFCLTIEGEPVWSRKIEPVKTRFAWGTGSSPILVDGKLIIVNDNESESYILALDARSGKEAWKQKRNEKSNWVTPFAWSHPGGTEIVTAGSNRVRSYSLDGDLIWEIKGMSSIAIPTPIGAGNNVLVTSGYVLDPRKPVYAVRPGAKGDISLKEGEKTSEFIAWSASNVGPYNPSPLVYRDRLYILYDAGMLACYDIKDGREIYGKQRLPKGRAFTASPWGAKGQIFCLSEYGTTFVIEAGDTFKIVRTNELGELCMACPALAGDRLLIRTESSLYCFRDKGR